MIRRTSLRSAVAPAALWVALACAGLGPDAPRSARAESLPTDEVRSAFRLRRAVSVPGAVDRAGFAVLPLQPELNSGGTPPWRDLRLHRLDKEGAREVPYIIDEQQPYQAIDAVVGTLVDTRSDRDIQTVWVVDLGKVRTFDRIEFEVPESEFAKRVHIELGNEQNGVYRTLRKDYGIFDRPWTQEPSLRIHHTSVELAGAEHARYIRITADDRNRNRPVTMSGVRVQRSAKVAGTRWTRPAPVLEIAEEADAAAAKNRRGKPPAQRFSRYRLDVPGTLPIEEITIDAADPAFVRRMRIVEQRAENERGEPTVRAEGVVFRVAGGAASSLAAGPEELAGEERTLRIGSRPGGQPLVLEVDNGQNPPLSGLTVTVAGTGARLIFPTLPGDTRFVLYYSSSTARAPLYDLAMVKSRLAQLDLAQATASAEEQNPRFRTAPPLQFVRSAGAALDTTRFRFRHTLVPGPGARFPEIFGVLLGAEDVALLRPDLADVRIIDDKERQVPYVLEAAASEARAELRIAPLPADPAQKQTSRFALTFAPSGRTQALPLQALELDIGDVFYSRPVRVLAGTADTDGRLQPAVLFSGRIARQGEEGASIQSIPLGGARHRELILEINNQDNPSLSVDHVLGVVTAPRLTFKLDEGGGYHLLLGADDVESPHYDIETLRQQVLDFAALPAVLGGTESNPQYRARAGDFVRNAPPTLILWGSLGVAVLALLGMTLRLLRKAPE